MDIYSDTFAFHSGGFWCDAGDSYGSCQQLEMGLNSLPSHGIPHNPNPPNPPNPDPPNPPNPNPNPLKPQIVIWAACLLFIPETPAHFIRWAC